MMGEGGNQDQPLSEWLKQTAPQDGPSPDSVGGKPEESLGDWLGRTDKASDGGLTYAWNQGTKLPADRAARVLRAQVATGYSPDFIDRNLDDVEAQQKKYGTDLTKLLAYTPLTAKYLAENPQRVGLFHKDIPHLATIETRLKEQPNPALNRRPDDVLLKEAELNVDANYRPGEVIPMRGSGDPEADRAAGAAYPTTREDLIQKEFQRLKDVEDFISGKGKLDYADVFKHRLAENPVEVAPFVGSGLELAQNLNYLSMAKHYEAKTATPYEIAALTELARTKLAEQTRGEDVTGKITGSAMGLVPFAGEVYLTGGAGALGKDLVLKGTKEAGASILRRVLARIVGAAVQTIPSGLTAIPAAAVKRATPVSNLEVGPDGNFNLTQTPGESPAEAAAKATYSRFADLLSAELVGMKFTGAGKVAPEAVQAMKQSIAKEGLKEAAKFYSMSELSSAIKSIPWGKARVQDWQIPTIIMALSGDHEAQTEMIAQTVVGFGMGTLGAVRNNMDVRRSEAAGNVQRAEMTRDTFATVSEAVKQMEADKKAPEIVQQAIGAQVKDTPNAFTQIPVEEFAQYYQGKGVDPAAFAEELTGKKDALAEAIPSGILQVPTEAYVSKIGKTDAGAYFQDKVTLDPSQEPLNKAQERLAKIDAEMEAERKAANDRQPQQEQGQLFTNPEGYITEENLKHAETLRAGYKGGDILEEADGTRWLVERNKRGGGYLTMLDEGGNPTGTVYDLNSKDALDKIARTRKVRDANIEDQAATIGESIASKVEAAGRPKSEASGIGKLVEAVYQMFWLRGKTTPEEIQQTHGPEIVKAKGPEDKRGGYSGRDVTGDKAVISVFESGNPSTVIHELGHHFLDVLSDLSKKADAEPSLKADFQKFLDWRKIESPEAWDKMSVDERRAHHEAWANAYEQWLWEGKAPSAKLRSVFQKFRAWLSQVYDAMVGKGIVIPDDIRGVFERLHASDAEIANAKERMGRIGPFMEDLAHVGMSPKDAEKLAELRASANAAATERLDREALEGVNAARKAEYDKIEADVRKGVREEYDQQPDAIARSIIETGATLDGTPVDFAAGGLKMSTELLEKKYGKEVSKVLPKELRTSEGGENPDFVAEQLGYSSGIEMIQKLSVLEGRDAAITRRTAEIMGKMRLAPLEDLPAKAKEALHNEQEQKLNAYEAEWALKNKPNQIAELRNGITAGKMVEEARKYADAKADRDSWYQNDPRIYERGEREAAQAAAAALKEGRWDDFIKQKERVILNAELHRAATEARDAAEKVRDKMRGTQTTDYRKEMFKAGRQYLAQIDDFNDRFSFRNHGVEKVEKLKSLRDFVESLSEDGYIAQIPDRLLNEAYRQNWREAPTGVLKEIGETVATLERQAELKNKLIDAREKRTLNEIIDANVKEIVENSPGKIKRTADSYDPRKETSRDISGAIGQLKKVSAFLREASGLKDGSSLHQTILRRINEAGTDEAVRKEKTAIALDRIFSRFTPLEQYKMHDLEYVPEIKDSISRWNRMVIAALLGQEGAAQRFKDGRGWDEKALAAIVKPLTEKEWKWVDDIHKMTREAGPEVAAQIEAATGLPAKMTKAVPIETPFGTLEGGHFPFLYDARTDTHTRADIDKEEAMRTVRAASLQATTKHGYREARQDRVIGKDLRIDLGTIFQHFRDLDHDLSHWKALLDVNRIVRSEKFREAINENYGDQTMTEITKWLDAIATGDQPAANAGEKAVGYFRRGTAVSVLGMNLMQAATDPVGMLQGAVRLGNGNPLVGAKWMAKGLWQFLGNPLRMADVAEKVDAESDFMRLRAKTHLKEATEVYGRVVEKGRAELLADMAVRGITLDKWTLDDITQSFYWLMAKVQQMQDIPTYLAAKEKFMSEIPEDQLRTAEDRKAASEKVKSMAEQVVLDSYGGGQIKDLARIQRGSAAWKIFLPFYSFASTTLNNAMNSGSQFTRAKTPANFGKAAADLLTLYSAPVILTYGIKRILTQDDDEHPAKRLAQEQAAQILGSFPLARELVAGVQGNDYSGPAGTRFFGAMNKAIKQGVQGKLDGRALNQGAGVLFHYPAGQLQKLYDAITAMRNGENPIPHLFGGKRKH